MSARILNSEELRQAILHSGFCVKRFAGNLGVGLRTLERRFEEQLCTTPKAWLLEERMTAALPLLAKRLSNKEVATHLGYQHESSFCREFKRYFGCGPQLFARSRITARSSEPFVAFG